MGKVIQMKDHWLKDLEMTVEQSHVLDGWIKWKGEQWRRWIAAQKEDSENNKPRLVSPK